MSDRNIKFIINNEITETRVINKGLPQGDVLSSTLCRLHQGYIERSQPSNNGFTIRR